MSRFSEMLRRTGCALLLGTAAVYRASAQITFNKAMNETKSNLQSGGKLIADVVSYAMVVVAIGLLIWVMIQRLKDNNQSADKLMNYVYAVGGAFLILMILRAIAGF